MREILAVFPNTPSIFTKNCQCRWFCCLARLPFGDIGADRTVHSVGEVDLFHLVRDQRVSIFQLTQSPSIRNNFSEQSGHAPFRILHEPTTSWVVEKDALASPRSIRFATALL